MKTIANYILLLMLLPSLAQAAIVKGKYTKEKKITKSYSVNNNAGLQVANKYGNVVVSPWDEDRTEIEVTITVGGNNQEDVEKRINTIDVEFDATKQLVKASTKIGSFRGRNINMEINYTVKIPRNGTLGIGNSYGGIKLGKINGGMNIDCQYGSLFIEEANAENNNISIQYCDASKIGYIKSGKLSMQYSAMSIAKAGTLTANTDYTDVTISSIADLNMNMDYGSLNIGRVDKAVVSADYSPCTVGRVDNILNINTEYGDVAVKEIAASAKGITINSSYGVTNLTFAGNAGFIFEFQTEYGNLSGKENLKFTEKSEKDYGARYKGNSASGSGQCKVYVKSEYGDIRVSRN